MDLQIIQNKIFEIRGCRIMLDFHLAELYQVETVLNNFSIFLNFPESIAISSCTLSLVGSIKERMQFSWVCPKISATVF